MRSGIPPDERCSSACALVPRAVGEIAEGLDVSRPAVSQHLKILKAARLVVDRAEGTRRLYAVDAATGAVTRC